MNVMKRVPIKEQEPHVRAANFEEVYFKRIIICNRNWLEIIISRK